jgi:hypothetical protein
VFEPADPRRSMPKWLVIGTIVGLVVLVALMSWLNNRSLEQPDETANAPAAEAQAPSTPSTAAAPAPQTPSAAAAGQPVVLVASQPVWFQVSEKGGATLFSGMLQPGQIYAVPPTATAPVLKTGKPEALQVKVGSQVAPPVGPPAKTVSNVSLLGADLMKVGVSPADSTAAAQAPAPRQKRRPAASASAPTPETVPAARATATNAGE